MLESSFTFKVSFAPALTKQHWGVRDDFFDPTPWTLDQIDVYAARNAVAGVQLRLAGSQDFTLVLDHANWLHPLGFLPRLRLDVRFPGLPGGVVECFAVGYVDGDDRRQWMEYLDRAGYADAPAHRPQAVYVRLRIPAGTPKGLYVGQVRLFSQTGFEDETPGLAGWDQPARGCGSPAGRERLVVPPQPVAAPHRHRPLPSRGFVERGAF